MARAIVALDIVRDGARLGDGDVEHVLLGIHDSLGDGLGNLGGLADAEADIALAVAHCYKSEQGHAAATLDGLGHAVNKDDALLKIGFLLALAITWHLIPPRTSVRRCGQHRREPGRAHDRYGRRGRT